MINKIIYRIMTLTLLLSLIVSLFGIGGVVSAQAEQTSYVVQRGDTLRLIATRYGITWQDIAIVNNLTNPNRIYPGQVLVIPRSSIPVEPAPQYYVVQHGDTLRLIALRYGTTWQALTIANNLVNPNLIHVGNVLVIPTGNPVITPPTAPVLYIVQAKDTLSVIALRYGVSMWDIARANNILNLNRIFVGQTLVIPTS